MTYKHKGGAVHTIHKMLMGACALTISMGLGLTIASRPARAQADVNRSDAPVVPSGLSEIIVTASRRP